MADDRSQHQPTVGIDIPPGYLEIPLDRIDDLADTYLPMVIEAIPSEVRGSAPTVVQAMQFLLGALRANNALYCGIGVHRFASSEESIVSWLTVSSFAYGPERNPRLVISDLIAAKADRGETGHLEVIELGQRPILYFERTVDRGRPDFEGYPDNSAQTAVFQIQATLTSPDGRSLAVIDFATADARNGPQYRGMVLGMAVSVEFPAPPLELGSLSLAL